jgi:signal transduction histidine kinase/CheY-like chemotaxis protein/HAMP domain-containing protein
LIDYSNVLIEFEDKKLELLNSFEFFSNKIDNNLDDVLQITVIANINDARITIKKVFVGIILSLIIVTIIGILIAVIVSRMLSAPILELVSCADKISDGINPNIDINLKSNDEIGQLVNSFQKIIDSNKDIEESAIEIGGGNFETQINLRSNDDSLGNSLVKMKLNLRDLSDKMKQESWLNSSLAGTLEFVQKYQKMDVLMQAIIGRLAEIINAGYGVIYLAKNIDKEVCLELVGSYAYTKRKNISNRFKLGEGIVGQCGLEKKRIILTNVPDDYIQISSGLGELNPLNIATFPVFFEDNLLGVLELASFNPFTDIQIGFLDMITKNLGIVISNIQSRTHTEELLDETKKMTVELKAQQEELQVSNVELEEKTKELQQSEEELKQQSEELRVSNEELEQKSTYLEDQKNEIEKQNTKIKLAQNDLETKASQLEIASKYKSEFLANMSHELRTPLNSLLILAKLFADNQTGNLNEEQIEQADIIYKGGQDLLNLINDILDLSKIEAGKLHVVSESIKIKDLVLSMNDTFKAMAESKKLEFTIDVDDSVSEIIKSDFTRIKQILKNLIANAIKFTETGAVNIKIFKPINDVKFKTNNFIKNMPIAFSIKDTGIGIPIEKQKQIFEAFQQAEGSIHRKYGGTGLGLTISRELVKRLNGELQLESVEGKGSIFTLYIPEESSFDNTSNDITGNNKTNYTNYDIEEKKVFIGKATNSAVFPEDDKKTIDANGEDVVLIIEDDAEFCKILKKMANEKGFKVLFAESGYAGIQMAAEYKPSGIILDLGLPDIDGIGVLNKLKSNLNTRHIPVHIITARDANIDILKKGAIGYFKKPVTREQIFDALNKIETLEKKDIKHILVVEDDIATQKAITGLIKNKHIEIHKSDTAQKALEEITKE